MDDYTRPSSLGQLGLDELERDLEILVRALINGEKLSAADRERIAVRYAIRKTERAAQEAEREARVKAARRFSCEEIDLMEGLPDRIVIKTELNEDDYDFCVLRHIDGVTRPFIKTGFYKRIHNGRLYIIEVPQHEQKGQLQSGFVMKPIIRV